MTDQNNAATRNTVIDDDVPLGRARELAKIGTMKAQLAMAVKKEEAGRVAAGECRLHRAPDGPRGSHLELVDEEISRVATEMIRVSSAAPTACSRSENAVRGDRGLRGGCITQSATSSDETYPATYAQGEHDEKLVTTHRTGEINAARHPPRPTGARWALAHTFAARF